MKTPAKPFNDYRLCITFGYDRDRERRTLRYRRENRYDRFPSETRPSFKGNPFRVDPVLVRESRRHRLHFAPNSFPGFHGTTIGTKRSGDVYEWGKKAPAWNRPRILELDNYPCYGFIAF